jgi:hypothetical protein
MSFAMLVPAPLPRNPSGDQRHVHHAVFSRISRLAQGLPAVVEHQPTIDRIAAVCRHAKTREAA